MEYIQPQSKHRSVWCIVNDIIKLLQSLKEVKKVIRKMKNRGKAPPRDRGHDEERIVPDEGIKLLASFLQQFWEEDPNLGIEIWHTAKLVIL